MDVTKPYEFIGFGAMDVTKPYRFTGFGAMDVTKPYRFIGFGAMDVTKPYKSIGFGGPEVGPRNRRCLGPKRPSPSPNKTHPCPLFLGEEDGRLDTQNRRFPGPTS
jgi:hypothetical protein